MAANAKQKEEIKAWFIKEFWPRYGGKHITPRQKGSRGESIDKMIKINPDEAERSRILANMIAQLRADDKLADNNEFVARWPMCITYLNKRRYDDEIESRLFDDDNGAISVADTCCHPGCENEVHGPKYRHCADHMPESSNLDINIMRDQLRKLGLTKSKDESMHDYCMRCRSYYVDVVKSGGLDKAMKFPNANDRKHNAIGTVILGDMLKINISAQFQEFEIGNYDLSVVTEDDHSYAVEYAEGQNIWFHKRDNASYYENVEIIERVG